MIDMWFLALVLVSQSVEVESLARELDLPVMDLSPEDFQGDSNLKGTFFKYEPPANGREPFGILRPLQDQSFSQPRQNQSFWPVIIEGRVADDVASSIRDKADQLNRQRSVRGPRLFGLGRLRVGENGESDLVLPVEHLTGERVPNRPEDRRSEVNDAFFDLFIRFTEAKLIPLDYRHSNVVIDGATGELRPIDLVLTTYEELEATIDTGSKLGKFREIQLAETILEIDRSSSDSHMLGYICRSIIKDLRTRFPGAVPLEAKILKKRSGQ